MKVAEYFHDIGGNQYKVSVKVLGINIEQDNPSRTTQFIKYSGMEDVADDFSRVAWRQFNKHYGIHLFIFINGVANSPSHDQWEVLYSGEVIPVPPCFVLSLTTSKMDSNRLPSTRNLNPSPSRLAKPRRSKSIPGEKRHYNSNGSSPASIFPRPLHPSWSSKMPRLKMPATTVF